MNKRQNLFFTLVCIFYRIQVPISIQQITKLHQTEDQLDPQYISLTPYSNAKIHWHKTKKKKKHFINNYY